MNNIRFFVTFSLLCAVSFGGCKTSSPEVHDAVHFLNSKFGCIQNDWQFQYQGKWYPATVPGNIHDDLLHNQLIPDPFFSANEDSVQWIAEQTWIYRLLFDKSCLNEREFTHHQLVFEGLDTYAEVYLNGQRLQAINGTDLMNNMFRRWTFNLPDNLKENDNELVVKFLPTAPMDSLACSKLPYKMPDNRVFTRKAQYQSGWDWGPKLNTCGIWKSVYIRSWNLFKKDNLYVYDTQTTLDPNGVWKCNVDFDLQSDESMKLQVLVECYDANEQDAKTSCKIFKKSVNVEEGINRISVPVSIQKPKLWWPNGMGEQNLYVFRVKILKGKTEYEDQMGLNCNTAYHGLRTIELKRETDSIGESFEFIVNGKPCFVRGADWIPASSYPSWFARSEGNDLYYQLLHDAQEVNMNMIRIWGGGLYEDDAFYSYCDQLGLMVWQDFMYACNPYPGDSLFLKNAKQEAVEQVCRLRNHPCLAIWCGNNEVHNGLEDWGWQGALGWTNQQYKQLFNDFNHLFGQLLPEVLTQYTHQSNYIASSPVFGWGHPECCTHGCSHYWGVWWGEQPFEVWYEKTGRFMSEYGFQSYPEMATLETFTTPNERVLSSKALANHQKHGRGVEIIRQAMKSDFMYNRMDDLAEFAYVSQLVQVRGIEMAIDAHRIQHNRCRGTLYWQLNDCWPVASWSSIDYTGRWKALHYRLKERFANITIALNHKSDGSVDVYVVNDSLATTSGVLNVEVCDLSGQNKVASAYKWRILPNTSKCVAKVTLPKGFSANNAFVKAQWVEKGIPKAERLFYFVKPGELKLSAPQIEQKIQYFDDHFVVELTSPTLQYGVHIAETTGKIIKWSDNYFDLQPGKTKTIVGYYDVLMGGKPTLTLRSFCP